MTKGGTEKETLIQHQQYAHKLRNLFLNDPNLFYQINKYIPSSIYINSKIDLDITYANQQLLEKGKEMELLVEQGASYLNKISCPLLLKNAKQKTQLFNRANDKNASCTLLQLQNVGGEMKFLHSHKLILDDASYFNVAVFFEDFGLMGKMLNKILKPYEIKVTDWQKFITLTKREKQIVKYLAQGYTGKEIAEQTFTSLHTVRTHKRNIFSKLDIHKTRDLSKYILVVDILD